MGRNMDVGKFAIVVVFAGVMSACGGGSGGSSENDPQQDADAFEIEHNDLGADVLLRTSGKGFNGSASEDFSEVELPLEDQESFEQFIELGSLEEDCDSGSLTFSYTSEVTTNPIRVDLGFDMEADECFIETVVENSGETSTIESTIDGLFSTDIVAEFSGTSEQDIALQSLVIEVDVAPESTEQIAIDGFEIQALINEYSLRIALEDEVVVLDGVEDVTTSIVVADDTTEIDQTFIYEELTFAVGSDDSCPQSGTVSGSVNGTAFEVSFSNSMIEVSITDDGTESFTCEQLLAILDDNLEVSSDEVVSEDDALDRAYANAAIGSATNFATNMMFSQGIIF